MMGRGKFLATLATIFCLLICAPAHAAIVTYGGSVDALVNPAYNPLNIDRVRWSYDDSYTYNGTDHLLPFNVGFYCGSNLMLSFQNNGAVQPAWIVEPPSSYVSYSSTTFSGDPSVLSSTLNIGTNNGPGSTTFMLDGQATGSPIAVFGTLNFVPDIVPIPGAFWLVVSGLVGFVGVKRKFRKILKG